MLNRVKKFVVDSLPSRDVKQNIVFTTCLALFFLYCFSIPTFSNRYPFNYVSIAICALMCIGMATYVFLYGKFKINIMVGLLILFNITIVITHLVNRSFGSIPKTIVLMSVVAFFAYEFLSCYKNKNLFFVAILLAGFIFSLIYIVHYRNEIISLSFISGSRLGLYFDNENEIAKEFGFFCAISIASAVKNKNLPLKIISYVLTFLLLALILTTGSISNLLTTILVCCIVFIACQKTRTKIIIASSIVLCLIVLSIILVQLPFMNFIKTRIDNIFSTLFNPNEAALDNSASDRFNGAIVSILIGLNRFLLGFGYMSAVHFTHSGIQAHNNFAELFIDFGIIGLAIYESLVLLPLFRVNKAGNKEHILSVALYMFIFQLFLTTYYKKFEYIFFALLFASMDNVFDTQFILFNSSRFRKHKPVVFEIIPSLTPVGGAEIFFVDFVKTFKEKYGDKFDLKIIILYDQNESNLLNELNTSHFDVYFLGKKKGVDLKAAFKLRQLIFEYNPEIIHAHLLSVLTLKLAMPIRRNRIKCFYTIHHNFTLGSKNQKLLKHLVKHSYLTPICVAKKPSEEFGHYFDKKPVFINNGVDLTRYDASIPLSHRKNDVLIVGRFVEVKNQKYLLDLISEEPCLKNYKFVFLGDGPLLDYCKEISKELKIEKNVSFKGFTTDVYSYMANSKLLVIPSLNEGNPIVVNEAFASGMGVVGNNVGGLVDLLKNIEIGGLCSISNRSGFAKAIDSTLVRINKGKFDKTCNNPKRYDIKTTVDSYYKLFFGKKIRAVYQPK